MVRKEVEELKNIDRIKSFSKLKWLEGESLMKKNTDLNKKELVLKRDEEI